MTGNNSLPEDMRRAGASGHRAWPRRIVLLVCLVAATAVGLTACSGGSSSSGAAGGGSSRLTGALSEALNFSRCMRAHGITGYPDPTAHGHQISMTMHLTRGSNLNPHSPQYQAAHNACRSFLPSGNLTAAQKTAANAKALTYSQCMRAHGITSYPDPNGQGTIVVQAGGGIAPNSPQFQHAQTACQSLDNGFNMNTMNFPS